VAGVCGGCLWAGWIGADLGALGVGGFKPAHASSHPSCARTHTHARTRTYAYAHTCMHACMLARAQDFEGVRNVLEQNLPLDACEGLAFEPAEPALKAIEELKARRLEDMRAYWEEHPGTKVWGWY
jgi:hypothetical protein